MVILPVVAALLAVEFAFLVHLIGWLLLFRFFGCGKNADLHQLGMVILSISAVAGGLALASRLASRMRTSVGRSMAIAAVLAAALTPPYMVLIVVLFESFGWMCGD